jgi:polysaccharide export outer membrane protein
MGTILTLVTRLVPVVVVAALAVGTASAASITAEQIQQLRSLSDDQKRALAQQYGLTLPAARPSRVISETPLQPSNVLPTDDQEAGSLDNTPRDNRDPLVRLRYGDLKPFGYNLFESEPTTFAPVGGVPAPEKYVIGPGDRLRVFLFGKETAEYELTVNRDGTLVIPNLDRLNVQGLSFESLRVLIEERVQQRKIGVTSVVTLDELRSIQVFVLGDVKQPGSFAVSAFSTLVNALFVAGGVTEDGSLRAIQLKRDGKTIATLDLYALLLRGDASGDVRVRQGDVVFVPSVGDQVAVRGEVKRPAIFEFKDGESLLDVVAFASGFSGFAFENEIRVRRTVDGVDRISKSISKEELPAYLPMSGDVVDVLPVNALPTKTVELSGLFSRPGFREWQPGLTLGDVVTSPRDLMIPPLESLLVVESRDIQGQLRIDLIRGSEIFSDPIVAARGMGNNDRVTLVPIQSQLETDADKDKDKDKDKDGKSQLNPSNNERDPDLDRKDLDEGVSINGENPETTAFKKKTEFDRRRFFDDLNQRVIASSVLTEVAPLIEVEGMVNEAGRYPLSTRATVGDLILAAGGFKSDADIKSVELVRRTGSGFDIVSVSAEQFNQTGLVTAGSQLIIRQDQDKTLLPAVSVQGFVKYPGVYRMPRGSTIGQLIQRAGGMLANADLRAAVFTRESIKTREISQLRRLERDTAQLLAGNEITGLDVDANKARANIELSKVLSQLAETEAVGRLVINLPSILAGQTNQDVILEDGDKLVVPSIRQSVTVIGEVLYPTSHVYQLNFDHEKYLELSGGPSARADMKRAFVIRADGSVMPLKNFVAQAGFSFGKSSVVMEPGDTLIVPRDLDDLPALDLWTKVTQIIYQSAVALAAVGSL